MDERFFLAGSEIADLLAAKGVTHLYHANTVLTSITFIQQNAILSRQFVEESGFSQTAQKSDAIDKQFNVWDDVFLDAVDLHKKYRNANFYGPVLFFLDLDVLRAEIGGVLVTKKNPIYWRQADTWDDKYYSNLIELGEDYLTGKKLDSQIMFTFRGVNRAIRLSDYLRGIGLDRPNIIVNLRQGGTQNIGDYARGKLIGAIEGSAIDGMPISIRHIHDRRWCSCHIQYAQLFNNNFPELKKRFVGDLV